MMMVWNLEALYVGLTHFQQPRWNSTVHNVTIVVEQKGLDEVTIGVYMECDIVGVYGGRGMTYISKQTC